MEKEILLRDMVVLLASRSNTHCDNHLVAVRGIDAYPLGAAIAMAVGSRKATHYKVIDDSRIVLYWHQEDAQQTVPLPFFMDAAAITDFLTNWLLQAKWSSKPNFEGSSSRGWSLSTGDGWGHVDGSFYSLFQLQTDWLMHGK